MMLEKYVMFDNSTYSASETQTSSEPDALVDLLNYYYIVIDEPFNPEKEKETTSEKDLLPV